ncbi:MAG: TlyA family RNA methyltransferase [Nitrospirae bacterium]|nr:TlyA family RNA methyltransferase [Nitrospirota bacterium]
MVFERGLTESREKARALIMEGRVLVDGKAVVKPGTMINKSVEVILKETEMPYVSRGGLKLSAAIEHFGIDLKEKTAIDVGASTGGFTDCMLKMAAKKVYAIDVGYGQFDWRLRQDSRVVLLEKTNIRYLDKDRIPDEIDIATIDVSFISLTKVIPKVMEFLKPRGEIIALIKPQFELQKADVSKGGIVRNEEKRQKAIETTKTFSENLGLTVIGVMQSPVQGQKGNIEYFIYLRGK